MKAWRVNDLGEPTDVMSLDELPDPVAGDGQVVMEILASGTAFPDLLQVRGGYQVKPPLPFTPGNEIVGRVTDVGSGVDKGMLGQTYAWLGMSGGFATHCVAPALGLLPVPDGLDPVKAACIPLNYCTMWFGLHDRGKLRAGETVLVNAGAGGIGSASIQLARHAGARVIATAGGPEKVEVCRNLGADVVIDYKSEDLVEAVKAATAGQGVDVAVEPVGGDVFDQTRRVMAWDGRLLVIGFTSGRIPEIAANYILLKNFDVVGVHWGASLAKFPQSLRQQWDMVMKAVAHGAVDPLVDSVRPLEEVPQSLIDIGARKTVGKVVIQP